MSETTLVLIKPDGVQRRLVGEILRRFEAKGLTIRALKTLRFDTDLARRHYKDHIDKDFYPELETFITSAPVVAAAIAGPDAIALVRALMGATSHLDALPGTIRGDLAHSGCENLVHGSDSAESAQREIPLFFADDELVG